MNDRVVIFLDVDGVLNSHRSCIAFGGFRAEDLDAVAIGLLNRLCECLRDRGKTPVVVISSAWRILHPRLKWWAALFEERGADCVEVIGMTPVISDAEPSRRGREVAQWLAENAPDLSFVCLDDDDDFLPGQALFQTDFMRGLGVEQVDGVLTYFTGKCFSWPERRP